MPKARGGGTTPSPNRRELPDRAHADAPAPGTDTGHPLVLVCGARPSVREMLAAQVVLLLPGARVYAGSRKEAPEVPAASATFGVSGVSGTSGATGMPVPSPRLVVRFVGADAAVPRGWADAPVAEVRPRDVDGEDAPAAGASSPAETPGSGQASGHADLADVALALARCGQLGRVAASGLTSGQRLSGAALTSAMPELLRPLLPGVWRTAEALIGQAGDALHARDMALLARVAHTVRGMAANYAMPEWAACAAALERSARGADIAAAADALAWLRAALSALSRLPGLSELSGLSALNATTALPGQSGAQEPPHRG